MAFVCPSLLNIVNLVSVGQGRPTIRNQVRQKNKGNRKCLPFEFLA